MFSVHTGSHKFSRRFAPVQIIFCVGSHGSHNYFLPVHTNWKSGLGGNQSWAREPSAPYGAEAKKMRGLIFKLTAEANFAGGDLQVNFEVQAFRGQAPILKSFIHLCIPRYLVDEGTRIVKSTFDVWYRTYDCAWGWLKKPHWEWSQ